MTRPEPLYPDRYAARERARLTPKEPVVKAPLGDPGDNLEETKVVSPQESVAQNDSKIIVPSIANKAGEERVGIAVICYNRPQYLSKVIQSLEKNAEAQTLPFYFFQDGGAGAPGQENIKLIEKSKIANKTIVQPNGGANRGCGRWLILARKKMFEQLGYDRIVLFEDDLVVSPHYISFVVNAARWADKNYSNLGTVSGYALNARPGDKQLLKRTLQTTTGWFWGYSLSKRVWSEISPVLYEYDRRFLRKLNHYSARNSNAIRQYFLDLHTSGRKLFGDTPFYGPGGPNTPDPYKPGMPSGQDACTAMALWHKGFTRLTASLPRGHYIGASGIHSTVDMYARKGFKDQVLYDFEEDATNTEFLLYHMQDQQNYPS